jgi:PAS domain S-box-containing protein
VIEPLLFQETMYGYAIFEQTAAIDSSLMGQLAEQISSALHNAFLIEEVERRAIQLQTAAEVSRAASSILDPAELWQQAVDMIREGFGLYYAGLFLRDDAGEWAILRAGTGEAGQKMLAAGWKLEIGGSSMIGQCIKNGQADIQLNIDKAPIHRRNPYLPETRSEMALPLFSRGEVIGALTIQSALEGAFSEEDVAVLQTMADQLANAIANTRLYEALAKEQSLMKALMENFPEPIYFKDSQSRFMRISNYMLANFNVSSPEEVIGKTDFDFFTEDHARPAYEAEQRIIATGEPLLNVEERETWPDRPDTWVLTSKLPLRDEQNNIIGTFGISRDITASKRTAQSLERRSVQLLASAEIARAAASILDPRELIKQIVQQVRAAFDLYYVGLFLTNPANQFAILQAGTGEAGEKMLASGWKLPIDQQSMIGRCIATGQADIQLDVEKAPARQRNPYLPDTRSEMALPLASRGQVLGALTIQSTQPAAFSEEDVAILQTMSAQVATAIANAQLFEQTQAALQALESTQRRYQLQAWSEYNQRRQISGYMHTAEGLSALESDLLPEVQKTLVEQQPLIWPGNGDEAEAEVTVPLTLRDQPIGVLGLKGRPGKRAWSEEEIALAKEIGEQFALAAESLRLLDETQRRAARERLVAEITTKIRATNDPQAMLSTAISELRQALHAQRTQVSIQPGVDAAPGSGERPPAGFPQNPSSDQVLPKRGKV